jgi:hypothetical protein
VASAEPATHVASAKSATHVATATTSTSSTSSLCTRSKKTPGKHRACQNHHHSSSHDLLHLIGRTCRHRTILKRCYSTKVISNVTMKGDGSSFLSPLLNSHSINKCMRPDECVSACVANDIDAVGMPRVQPKKGRRASAS